MILTGAVLSEPVELPDGELLPRDPPIYVYTVKHADNKGRRFVKLNSLPQCSLLLGDSTISMIELPEGVEQNIKRGLSLHIRDDL